MTKTDAWRKTQEDFFNNILPLTLLQGFERVVQGLHGRGCWRPNINFIFWPHCYDRHVVSLLFSWCWGLLHRVFLRAPSVGCGLPYHILSLLSGILLTTASGVSEVPLGRVWPSQPHLVSNPLGVCWQLLGTQTQLSWIITQRPHDRLLDLWIGCLIVIKRK